MKVTSVVLTIDPAETDNLWCSCTQPVFPVQARWRITSLPFSNGRALVDDATVSYGCDDLADLFIDQFKTRAHSHDHVFYLEDNRDPEPEEIDPFDGPDPCKE